VAADMAVSKPMGSGITLSFCSASGMNRLENFGDALQIFSFSYSPVFALPSFAEIRRRDKSSRQAPFPMVVRGTPITYVRMIIYPAFPINAVCNYMSRILTVVDIGNRLLPNFKQSRITKHLDPPFGSVRPKVSSLLSSSVRSASFEGTSVPPR
jgi:hypothetical protein